MSEFIPGGSPDEDRKADSDIPEFDPEAAKKRAADAVQSEAEKLLQDDPEQFKKDGWSLKNLGERVLQASEAYAEVPKMEDGSGEETLEEKKARYTEEFSRLSGDEVPEGVRDAQDYVEYKMEQEARELELKARSKEYEELRAEKRAQYAELVNGDDNKGFLIENGFSEEDIDYLLFDWRYVSDDEGNYDRAHDEINQELDYLLYFGHNSIKYLSETGLFDKSHFLKDVEIFADRVYYVTDQGYNPDFNQRYDTVGVGTMIGSILERRHDNIDLDKQQRDFIYDLYNEEEKDQRGAFSDVADILLFGKGDKAKRVQNLAEEVGNLIHDNPSDFADRVLKVENKIDELRRESQFVTEREKLDQAIDDIMKHILGNLPDIRDKVDELYAQRNILVSDDGDENQIEEFNDELSKWGEMLLRNCGPNIAPFEKIGEMMEKCGIKSNRIIDTYYGGPQREYGAYYSDRGELRKNIINLVSTGISKADIIDNIRGKNIDDGEDKVIIDDETISDMRYAGFSNEEILRCYNPEDVAVLVDYQREVDTGKIKLDKDGHGTVGYRDKGFSDQDIINYMAQEIIRR